MIRNFCVDLTKLKIIVDAHLSQRVNFEKGKVVKVQPNSKKVKKIKKIVYKRVEKWLM